MIHNLITESIHFNMSNVRFDFGQYLYVKITKPFQALDTIYVSRH